ncbi:MAG: DNA polymerase III subunit delta [bacterium]
MSVEQIISDWKRGATHPVYWLEGEEPYYIDKVTHYAEHELLPPEQTSFNLTVFYGKDSKVEDVLNSCRRYPMFADRQVVILKEAQHMKEIDKLEPYITNPLISTIFIVAHKDKKLDGRSKLAKHLKNHAKVISTKKLYDNELPEWSLNLIGQKGLEIKPKALQILLEHLGNDLQRIENEIDKLVVNLKGRNQISEDDIESFVGVSKEFNIFELQAAIINKDLPTALKILNYFASNPKAAPIQLILPTLYAFFSKLYAVSASNTRDENAIASILGLKGFFAKQYMQAMQRYSFSEVEKVLILLQHYNLKSIGIDKGDVDDAELMKEFVAKVILNA